MLSTCTRQPSTLLVLSRPFTGSVVRQTPVKNHLPSFKRQLVLKNRKNNVFIVKITANANMKLNGFIF